MYKRAVSLLEGSEKHTESTVETVAIYHLSAQIISRGKGGSAVAAAAYRSGETLTDERTGASYDYSKRVGVEHADIIAPAGTAASLQDRETLHNTVEATEDKSNHRAKAQLLRELNVTLPWEIGKAARIDLARRFVADEFVSLGMIADLSVHRYGGFLKAGATATDEELEKWQGRGVPLVEWDTSQTLEAPHVAVIRDDAGEVAGYYPFQPHFHVLLTMRRLNEAGDGFAKTKAREWNDVDFIKRKGDGGTDWHKPRAVKADEAGLIQVWRTSWMDYANRALEDAASAARIDHRAKQAQGSPYAPQHRLGLLRYVREVTGKLTTQQAAYKLKQARNRLVGQMERLLTQLKTPAGQHLAEFGRKQALEAAGPGLAHATPEHLPSAFPGHATRSPFDMFEAVRDFLHGTERTYDGTIDDRDLDHER